MFREEADSERLKECVRNISSALKEGDQHKIVRTCFELGLFLQINFPGKGLDDIQKALRRFKDCESWQLPPVDFLPLITEGKIRAYEDMVTNEEDNQEKILSMDALSKGIAMFGTLVGGDRFQKELEKLPYPDEQDINLVQKVIVTQTDQIAESIQSIIKIEKIEKECRSYEKYLEDIVTADVSKNPTAYSKYGLSEEKNNIDIKQLASTYLQQVKSDKDISKSVRIAIEKYNHVNAIHNTIHNQNIDVDERLNQAGNLFQSSKHFLEKRRDTKGIIFLKAVGTVFSLGIAAPFLWKKTKGSEIIAKMGSFFPKKPKNEPNITEVETTNTKTHKK